MIFLFEIIIILLISVTMDLILGDPNNKIHPVAWLGKYINYFILKINFKHVFLDLNFNKENKIQIFFIFTRN